MSTDDTSKSPEEPGVEVLEIPSDKLDEAAEALKPLLGDGGPEPRLSGTGCRHTTGGDLHCGDTDQV
ncbi:hypothetical protein ABIA65_000645 [Mycolicibacterium sp. 624]|jgi:hypothetical protein